MDRRADAVVRAAAGHGRLHRPLPDAPGRGHVPARRVARGAGRGAAGGPALRQATCSRARKPPTSRARSTGCAGTSPRPRPPTARRAGAGASRSPAWRCCGWRRATSDAAAAAIRRALAEASERPQRARLLPACVEILLAAGDAEAARVACDELSELAEGDMLDAMAAFAQGSVELAAGDAGAAAVALRRAARGWQQLEAPFEVARARMQLALACRAVGRRRRGGVRAGGRSRRVRRARSGAGPGARRAASRPRRDRRPDAARAGGAAPAGRRQEQPRHRRPRW